MLVQVNWTNNRYDYVKDFMLDSLIEAGVVARFLRSSGWVTIGEDPIRSDSGHKEYTGGERRSLHHVAAAE
jgi:NADPH-dependent curcumin reductase CurA